MLCCVGKALEWALEVQMFCVLRRAGEGFRLFSKCIGLFREAVWLALAPTVEYLSKVLE